MDSADRQVLDALIGWRDAGRRAALATVARTWGSSPRPPGSWAAFRDDGAVAGSVSGGCIEDDLVRRVREGLLDKATPEVLTYGGTQEEAARFGLPCGGTVQSRHRAQPGCRPTARVAAAHRGWHGDGAQRRYRHRHRDAGRSGARTIRSVWDSARLTTIHGPRLRLLIIGAVQVSSYLATMAQALGYQVTVCDPREEYHGTWKLDGAHLSTAMPDDAVTALQADSGTAIVALTHDPKLDDLALLEALRSPAFYVGALGSRRNSAKRRERLAQHFGMTTTELDRLHGPVGLNIGSRTPPEIAVSILAEMTAAKYGVDSHRG